MGKNFEPKCKQCRRIGEKLMLKGERCDSPKCAMVKRNYPPGFHGQKGRPRQTDFGMQLAEKQKAKKQYNLMEKQFKLIFDKSKKQAGDSGENFLKLLEMRLDNAIYRLGFAESRPKARQLVSHGHLLVNNKKVNIPSFLLKEGDVVAVKKSSKTSKAFKDLGEKLKKYEAPGWLSLDTSELSGKVLHAPAIKDLSTNINTQVIVEYYSR